MSGPTIDRANSSGDIWTPWPFAGAVTAKFGPIAFDLAATLESSKAQYAGMYFDEAADALTRDWHKIDGLLWLNPPYSNITPWAKKCYDEWLLDAEILLLVPMGSQNWYWDYVEPFAQVYCVGRMVFDNCFDRHGELVKTAYPKDLILAHYQPGKHSNRPQRWRWNQ